MGTETKTGHHQTGILMGFGHHPTGTSMGFDHHPMDTSMGFDYRLMANQDTYRRGIADHHPTETGCHPTGMNRDYRTIPDRPVLKAEGSKGA